MPLPHVLRGASLMLPPTPILKAENWPLLSMSKPVTSDKGASGIAVGEEEFADAGDGGQWGEEDNLFDDEEEDGAKAKGRKEAKPAAAGAGAWAGDDDLDISDDEAEVETAKGQRPAGGDSYVSPTPGVAPTSAWCSESSHAGDHFAAGSVETALNLLNRQIAASKVASIRPRSLPHAYLCLPCAYHVLTIPAPLRPSSARVPICPVCLWFRPTRAT